MYSLYKSQHQDEGEARALDTFESTIRGAIEKGFRDAKEILGVLNAMSEGISEDIDTTYDLVQERLEDWFEHARSPQEERTAPSEEAYEVATF